MQWQVTELWLMEQQYGTLVHRKVYRTMGNSVTVGTTIVNRTAFNGAAVVNGERLIDGFGSARFGWCESKIS